MKDREKACAVITLGLMLFVHGCSMHGQPRTRMGSLPRPTPTTFYIDIDDLGTHCYKDPLGEGNGIIYTCKGGYIDTAHVRIAADYIYYLNGQFTRLLRSSGTECKFRLNTDQSICRLRLRYPENWDTLDHAQRQTIIHDLALELSCYCTYAMVTWHEMLTWYGYKSAGLVSEFASAFSWEDNYSNILGVYLGAWAVDDPNYYYDQAMTGRLKRELAYLGPVSSNFIKRLTKELENKWYQGELVPKIMERNVDIGLGDGFVRPTLIEGLCPATQALSLRVPRLNKFYAAGFSMRFQIEPREFEKDKILKVAFPDGTGEFIEPVIDFPTIIDAIKTDCAMRGYNCMPPKQNL